MSEAASDSREAGACEGSATAEDEGRAGGAIPAEDHGFNGEAAGEASAGVDDVAGGQDRHSARGGAEAAAASATADEGAAQDAVEEADAGVAHGAADGKATGMGTGSATGTAPGTGAEHGSAADGSGPGGSSPSGGTSGSDSARHEEADGKAPGVGAGSATGTAPGTGAERGSAAESSGPSGSSPSGGTSSSGPAGHEEADGVAAGGTGTEAHRESTACAEEGSEGSQDGARHADHSRSPGDAVDDVNSDAAGGTGAKASSRAHSPAPSANSPTGSPAMPVIESSRSPASAHEHAEDVQRALSAVPEEATADVQCIEAPAVQMEFRAPNEAELGFQPLHHDKAKAMAEQFQTAMQGMLSQFGSGLAELPQGELCTALVDWTARLADHMHELQAIVERKANTEMQGPSASQPSTFAAEVAGLSAEQPPEEVTTAWADPEETAREVAELRRVRRQIRCLFGSALRGLPDSSNLRADEVLSEDADAENAEEVSSCALAEDAEEVRALRMERSTKLLHSDGRGSLEVRPRSGGTELSSSTAPFAVSRRPQAEDDERHRAGERQQPDESQREHRERRHRRHHQRRSDSTEAMSARRPREGDVALPRQCNWAEEIIKASFDPQSQWEFPRAVKGASPGVETARLRHPGQLLWEQPRQAGLCSSGYRGQDVVMRVRDRAEEVQRLERKQLGLRDWAS